MKQIYYIGVDISKEKIDVAVIDQSRNVLMERVVKNDDIKINQFFNLLCKKLKVASEQVLVCCEETGIYKRPLVRSCMENKIALWIEIAIRVKKASHSMRGKTDKKDALMIADYALRYNDRKILYQEPTNKNKDLQVLLNARETFTVQMTQLKQQISESKRFDKEKYSLQNKYFTSVMKSLKKNLLEIEKAIDQLVQNCPEMTKNLTLLTSIPGIGRQTALQFIVHTKNFTQFRNARHLACYSGVAPFPNESGTIIKKARVSHLANKKLKKLLHLAAMACVKTKGELKMYYIRKVQEGKNKMLVLNNLRNKLIKRMFSVINRGTPYFSINLESSPCILT